MTVQVRKGGTWRTITSAKVFASGAWRDVIAIKVYKAGWRTVFTGSSSGGGGSASLSLNLSTTSLSAVGNSSVLTTGSVTVTPTGGLAPYTYRWSFTVVDGNATWDIDSETTATTTVTGSGLTPNITAHATAHVVVTDSNGVTATSDDVAITLRSTDLS
jgi:hypothetical protein